MTARLSLLAAMILVATATAWIIPRAQQPLDRQGVALRLLDEGRAGEAVYLFDDPAWRGVAEYRAGRYRRALGAFLIEESVLTLYNGGNAYAKLQEWAGAKAAYRKVLRLDPGHEDARHNLELVTRADALEQRLLAESRKEKNLGRWKDGNRDRPQRGSGESNQIEQGAAQDGALRPTSARSDRGGRSDQPGSSGETALSESALGGPADAVTAGSASADSGTGSGAVDLLRESAQSAEILLGEIIDDPAKVLAARLRMAQRQRLEGGSR